MDFKAWVRQQWDRFAGWGCIALGAIALLLGWLGVSRTAFPAEQLPYILSGGVFGLFLLGLGVGLLLSADLRDEWRKLDDIEDAIRSTGFVATREVVVTQEALARAVESDANGTTPRRRLSAR